LVHDLAAVDLHRDLTDVEHVGYLLVHLPRRHQRHHLPLAGAQCAEAIADLLRSTYFAAASGVLLNGDTHRIEHVLIAERLEQKIHGTGLHAANGHRNIAVARHEYDRYVEVLPREPLLQLESADARQPYVQYQARRTVWRHGVEELLRRPMQMGLEVH